MIKGRALVAGLGTLGYDCAMLINRNDVASHLFGIPGLDLSDDLFVERLAGPWFRLGTWTIGFLAQVAPDDRARTRLLTDYPARLYCFSPPVWKAPSRDPSEPACK